MRPSGTVLTAPGQKNNKDFKSRTYRNSWMAVFINRWADLVLHYRLPIIVFTVLLVPAMLLTGKPIPFDNTTERYFVAGDPTLTDFNVLLDLFGDNEYLIIGFENLDPEGDIFTAEVLQDIHKLTGFLENQPAVTQVRSLTNYQYTHADGDDIRTEDLVQDVEELVGNPALLDAIRTVIRGEEMARGTLISEDFQHARLTARVEYRHDTAEHKVQLAQALYDFVEQENLGSGDYRLRLSGQPLMAERFETLAAEDTSVLIPLMAVVMVIMLLVSFRSVVAALLPWVVIGVGVLGVLEIQSYLGLPHTTVDEALVPTLIIIGIGVAVHVLVEFYHYRNDGLDAREAAHRPCLPRLLLPPVSMPCLSPGSHPSGTLRCWAPSGP